MKNSSSRKIILGTFFAVVLGWGVLSYKSHGAPQAKLAPSLPRVLVAQASEAVRSTKIESLGTALANESIEITAEVSKKVKGVYFTDGQTVKAGDVLVQLENQAELAELNYAEAYLSEQRGKYARYKSLFSEKFLSKQDLETQEHNLQMAEASLQTIRAKLNDLRITAPFKGVLGLRQVSVGDLVTPGTLITTLDDLSKIKVDFAVSEKYALTLKPGQKLSAGSVASAGKVFEGTVIAVSSRIDPSSRTAMVRGLIDNSDRLLHPGMLLNIEVSDAPALTLFIPEKAVLSLGEMQFVFVLREDKTVERRPVSLSDRLGDGMVAVAKGLKAGETIVTDGLNKLADGAKVDIGEALR